MDGRRNGLGIIAIALGALALVVALVGQIGPRVSVNLGDYDERTESRSAQVAPTAQPGDSGRFTDEERRERFFGRGERMEHGWGGPPWADGRFERDHRHVGFFPFMILGGLLKLGTALALILLGLRLFRGGRGGRGPWRGRPAQVYEPMPGQSRREPPHTSETSYL
jgi:hypothetical protein